MMPEDEVERIITAVIERHAKDNAPTLASAILEALWEAGYDVRLRPEMIPIRQNADTDDAAG